MSHTLFSNPDLKKHLHDPFRIGLLWLVQLRWWAVAGQILTIAIGSYLFHLELPIFAISAVIVIEIITNPFLPIL